MQIKRTLLFGCLLMVRYLSQAQSHYQHYHFLQSKQESKGWLVMLPGSSGLTVFGDTTHYFNTAARLNKEGYHVLLIDYKAAYLTSGRKVKERTGEKILWVLKDAVTWAKEKQLIEGTGGAIGWSLAGEGLMLLANDVELSRELNIGFTGLYYPSNKYEIVCQSQIPVLVFIGGEDNISQRDMLESTFADCDLCETVTYEHAAHGFDIESLREAKSVRMPKLFGKKYTFKYDPEAAARAEIRLLEFIREHLN